MTMLAASDIHGFFDEFIKALQESGAFENKNNKLVLLGDFLDRGDGALKLVDFLVDLLKENRLILIRGNHEELLEDALFEIERGRIWEVATASHHKRNGTFDSLLQLSQMSANEAVTYPKDLVARVKNSAYYKILLPSCVDYYETDKYVFVHGWIPCHEDGYGENVKYSYNPDWRTASYEEWNRARWQNGAKLAVKYGVVEPDKTIVCGHWHASYGHAHIERKCTEFGPDADYTPFYAEGVIAIDACVPRSGKINCVVLND